MTVRPAFTRPVDSKRMMQSFRQMMAGLNRCSEREAKRILKAAAIIILDQRDAKGGRDE